MENTKLCESLRVIDQGIADVAETLRDNSSEDIVDSLLVDLHGKYDLLESLMIEF